MKIKEVQAGVKISRNYNSYSVNLVADVEGAEIPEEIGEILIQKAEKIVQEKIGEQSEKGKLLKKEVGAAWIHKKSPNFLSVKFFGNDKWEDLRINKLEKTKKGYIWKKDGENFVFKKISQEKRKNDKMPFFRIYGGKDE